LLPTREFRHQLLEEFSSLQRNFKPILALHGANREFASIVSQPESPRIELQDLWPVRADHWVGQGSPTQFLWSSIVDEFTSLAARVHGHRPTMGMRP
jgi:hypothetical protein